MVRDTRLPLVQPMLASTGKMPVRLEEWALEIKFDGARAISYLDGTGLRVLTRSGNNTTARYPELDELHQLLGGRNAILDGEVIATDASGRPSFSSLQQRMMLTRPQAIRTTASRIPVTLMVFDVLWLDGRSTTGMSYRGRREVLDSLPLQGEHVLVPPAWPGTAAEEALSFTHDQGLEGVIAKRLASPYSEGARSRDWIKRKHQRTLDVWICGWVPTGNTVKALLLGVPDDDGLRYVGAVGTGFSEAERRALAALLERLAAPASPLTSGPTPGRGSPVRWVRPLAHGEVEYLEFTKEDGVLRHPVWKGLRGSLGE
ncbi:non-homologous end-joining DNA ligase [Streptacidiphilus sp. BW17]|uniref:non-homologous end-joining DNA ligase n=1 Tax=Streptacidiphilus sp. BW17 TaxID=3156274 RepID=UPI003516639D